MTCKQTQAQKLYAILRRKAMTYLDLQMTGISTSPHKRLAEGTRYLRPGERLKRSLNKCGLVTFRVVRG